MLASSGRLLALAAVAAVAAVPSPAARPRIDVWAVDRERILKAANAALPEKPVTVTAATSPRSAGGLHDYFSEADYWWPDPANPGGPYVQRDGLGNPENFDAHRKAMRRLSVQAPALVAAWKLTGEPRYAEHAVRHLRAWFVDADTRMSPHLRYAQAIHGRVPGRGTGIIDTLHLVEVARATEALEGAPGFDAATRAAVRGWFADYVGWMTTDKNGIEEREAKNNHGTCWVLQVAAFARLAGDTELQDYCRSRFKTVLLPNQMAPDGSFPEELRRTKPYGYSLFNLEALAGIAQLLSTPTDDLWAFTLPDGRGLRRGMQFMVPYIRDKKSWPRPPDVMHDREWPMRQASLLFAGLALPEPSYIELWRKLPADSDVDEVIRNFFIRQPALWVDAPAAAPAVSREEWGAPAVHVAQDGQRWAIAGQRHRVDWPGPLEAGEVDYTVLPNLRGNLIPRGWSQAFDPIRPPRSGDGGSADTSEIQSNVIESWSMSFRGFKRGPAAMMVIVETPNDAAYQFRHPAGGPTVVGPRWRASLGRLAYPRAGRMCFFADGDYVTLAKRYRRHAMESGLFVSLREKIARTPRVTSLIGTPLTRLGILRNRRQDSQRYERRKDTTWAHQIATAVVFTSPVLVYGGHPQSLRDNPTADLIKSIPSVWDETRVLPASAIGELAAFARRHGEGWFLGVLNGKERRSLRVPLAFLGKGRYQATLVRDDPANGGAVQIEPRELTARDVVDIPLRDGGGFMARFSR